MIPAGGNANPPDVQVTLGEGRSVGVRSMSREVDDRAGQPSEVARILEIEGSQSAGSFLGGSTFATTPFSAFGGGLSRGEQTKRSGSS